jgi:hypothetical protein
MAIKQNSKTAASNTQDYKKADAFLNLVLVDSQGTEFRLGKGLPLDAAVALHKVLIANADKTFNLKGTVTLVTDAETIAPVFA